jgi:Zn-dependent M28 family amino/carboxypeptidase
MHRTTVLASITGLVAASLLVVAPIAPASGVTSGTCDSRTNDTLKKLLECVTLDGVREHQAALQAIADANGGTRAAGTSGYQASVDYAAGVLTKAGYNVTVQPFSYVGYEQLGPSTLEQTSPASVSYVEDVDFLTMDFSASGDVTASVTAVDVQLGVGNTSTSGCEAADFAGFPAGNIALVQRGTCSFEDKAENAAAAGATAVIIFNQGNTTDPSRTDVFGGTLGADFTGGIPAVSTSYASGVTLANTPGLVMRVATDTFLGVISTSNVLAESRGGNPGNVVMVGAHLDSVAEGPGINDNGSGTAAILETAQQMAKVSPRNKVRFALWGAEEAGLVGSYEYVFGLSDEERAKIAMYLNFDMIGSPNYVRFVYDGDGSAFGLEGPPGSGAIENYFTGFYSSRGLASEPTEISFRSDYAAFFDSGIPFGGLFTGAEGIKSAAQAATYGGTAGAAYDPCYHQACDTFANNNNAVLDLNSDAVAAATLKFAMSTSSVNGVKGKGNFQAPAHDDYGPIPSS